LLISWVTSYSIFSWLLRNKKALAHFGHDAPDSIERKVILDGGVEHDGHSGGKFLIFFPKNISQGDFRENREGESFIPEKELHSAQAASCAAEGFRVFPEGRL
jgi:hypothetical protein